LFENQKSGYFFNCRKSTTKTYQHEIFFLKNVELFENQKSGYFFNCQKSTTKTYWHEIFFL